MQYSCKEGTFSSSICKIWNMQNSCQPSRIARETRTFFIYLTPTSCLFFFLALQQNVTQSSRLTLHKWKKMRELISSDSTCLSCFCPRLFNWTPCCFSSSNNHLWLDSHGFKLKAKIHCAICVSADYFKKLECNYYFLV